MAHPSHYYIRYLMARHWPWKNDEEWRKVVKRIDNTLEWHNLPLLLDFQSEFMRINFCPPGAFMFNNKEHEETVQFMNEEQVHSMWDLGEDEKRVLGMLQHKGVQKHIRMLMMGRLDHEQVVDKTRIKFQMGNELSTRMVQIYNHYFWNYNMVSDEEWSSLLYNLVSKDEYIASGKGSKDGAAYRAGYQVKVDGRESLKDAHRAIHFRLEATRWMPDNKTTAEIITKYTKELVTVYNALFAEGAGYEEMMRRFRAFVLATEPQEIKSLAKLASEGSHSESG